jgi:surface antigen
MNLFICLVCLSLIGGGVSVDGTAAPINILDSAAYKQQKTLDNVHTFLGLTIPKHLYIQLTDKDKHLTQRVLENALEISPSFVEHKWNNIDNQHRGSIVVMPVKDSNGHKCRAFNVRFFMGDEHYELEGKSCRINGKWDISLK